MIFRAENIRETFSPLNEMRVLCDDCGSKIANPEISAAAAAGPERLPLDKEG